MLGPPGVGKGTQADLLASKFNLPKIATGDILRNEIKAGTPLGRIAQKTIGQGKLVADDIVIQIIEERLKKEDCAKGYILDGFPRTVAQAEALSKIATIDRVLSMKVDNDIIIKRLEGRRTCSNCQRMYHLSFHKPKKEGICDACGSELIRRKDDNRVTIEKRLVEYDQMTKPLITHYRDQKILREVDGLGSMEDVFARILAQLDS